MNEYEVLDQWHEKLGVGTNATTVVKFKIRQVSTGEISILVTDEAGNVLTGQHTTDSVKRVERTASKIHPRLLELFSELAVRSSEGEQMLTAIVWFVCPEEDRKEIEAASSPSR